LKCQFRPLAIRNARPARRPQLRRAIGPSYQPKFAGAPPPRPDQQSYCITQIVFRENFPEVGLKARLLHEKLSRVGELFYTDPA